ncbi:MAG TPA: isoprenylcysteine carboxylmethyltransferase family protein [Steroidobacteraceae bacterium]|nr:isoprenylcysteine carboxylmethyltransferase family protein [Steroidobacteraceae bacterium]
MPRDPQFYRHLILWAWCAWALYWLVSSIGNKATQRREPLGSRLAYVLPLVLGGVLLGVRELPWAALLGTRLWPRSFLVYCIGLLILLAGLAFAVWARMHLGRNWSGAVTVKEGHELIRTGPYRFVRHPIYTGILTAVIGTAVCSGTLRAVLGFALIASALAYKLRKEEAFMREVFPGQYDTYRAEVPALIPFTKPRRSAGG